jgi:tRNA(fMet)-specific endonuclease VapC
VSFLLDTNACIALINGIPPAVRRHFDEAVARDEPILVSSIVQFELWYGIGKSGNPARNTDRLSAFLSGAFTIIDFDSEDARMAGMIRAELESEGRPIGPYDLLIAGQAMRHHVTLVTANQREFARIKKLEWVDWTTA